MANDELSTTESRQSFFQNAITRMATHWSESQAVKELQVTVLDKERETILKAITLALDVNPAWPITKGLIVTFTPYMERRGHWDAWEEVLSNAIEKAKVQEDDDTAITLTALLARLYQRQTKYKEMVQLYRQAIQLAKRNGNQYEEARACSNLGYYFVTSENFWRAEVLNCHALDIFKKLKSGHGLAHTHNHLGQLYKEQFIWKKATFHFKAAMKFWQKIQDNHGLAYAYNNIGLTYLESDDFVRAKAYFEKALEKAELTGDILISSLPLRNLAIAYVNEAEYLVAKQYALKAEKNYRQYEDKLALALTWQILGEISSGQGDWAEAESYFNEALRVLDNLGNIFDYARVLASKVEHFLLKRDSENFEVHLQNLTDYLYENRIEDHIFFKNKIKEYRF